MFGSALNAILNRVTMTEWPASGLLLSPIKMLYGFMQLSDDYFEQVWPTWILFYIRKSLHKSAPLKSVKNFHFSIFSCCNANSNNFLLFKFETLSVFVRSSELVLVWIVVPIFSKKFFLELFQMAAFDTYQKLIIFCFPLKLMGCFQFTHWKQLSEFDIWVSFRSLETCIYK